VGSPKGPGLLANELPSALASCLEVGPVLCCVLASALCAPEQEFFAQWGAEGEVDLKEENGAPHHFSPPAAACWAARCASVWWNRVSWLFHELDARDAPMQAMPGNRVHPAAGSPREVCPVHRRMYLCVDTSAFAEVQVYQVCGSIWWIASPGSSRSGATSPHSSACCPLRSPCAAWCSRTCPFRPMRGGTAPARSWGTSSGPSSASARPPDARRTTCCRWGHPRPPSHACVGAPKATVTRMRGGTQGHRHTHAWGHPRPPSHACVGAPEPLSHACVGARNGTVTRMRGGTQGHHHTHAWGHPRPPSHACVGAPEATITRMRGGTEWHCHTHAWGHPRPPSHACVGAPEATVTRMRGAPKALTRMRGGTQGHRHTHAWGQPRPL